MPLTVPPRWSHGDTPTAAEMQKYSDGQTWLNEALGNGIQQAVANADGGTVTFVHVWRWLHYQSTSGQTPTLSDPSGTGDDVNLEESTDAMVVKDLAEVSWLTQGQVYVVTGCDYATEDYSA